MEIKSRLNVPAPFFYKKVIDSALYDIAQATNKNLKEKELEGFEYIKTFANKDQAKIKIERVNKDRCYHFKTSTNKNIFKVVYQISELDENSCQIAYQETMESVGIIQQMNDLLVGIILGYFKKKQFKAMLAKIESTYLSREEYTQN